MAACLLIAACTKQEDTSTPRADEATRAGRDWTSLGPADEDYFADMDKGLSHHPEQVATALPFVSPKDALDLFVKGRNNWIAWTGGNDTLWDYLANNSFGALDFLKTLSTHPSLGYGRGKGEYGRWQYLGLVNEPCFAPATGPDPKRYGLWLDTRITSPECPPDPFANSEKYPGVKIGARGSTVPVGSYYGEPSGVVGLRLFPNPNFDAQAAAKWDPVRFYTDPSYYQDKNLVRPYRVGMSCGFCHVGPSPVNPPADPENPKWENLASNPGAQYFWVDRVFFFQKNPTDNFVFQLFHSQLPGTLDTSLVSSDNINNPRTMNAIYALMPRLQQAGRYGKEKLAGGELNNKQFNDYPALKPLNFLFQPPDTSFTPRVLKDGADSVGALGALNRVYLNIGLASEEWIRHFMPLIGPTQLRGPVTPIQISDLEKISSFWKATEAQTPAVAAFFLASATPDLLKDAPGGSAFLTAPQKQVDLGKAVFADRCARCHSSKTPELPADVAGGECADGGNGPQYLRCWNKYWDYTKTAEFKAAMRTLVTQPDFLKDNFLSSERRVPVTLLETNACSPLATNAIADNIWDNFSSQSYKTLPSVGDIVVYNPVDGTPMKYSMPGGGRGYTRPASLISIWSTAPFLLNNSLGPFDSSPSVESRLKSFDESIHELLWPERRRKDQVLPNLPGYIERTTTRSYLRVAYGYLPDGVQELFGWRRHLPGDPGMLEIGPIPAGTPIGLLGSLPLISDDRSPDARVKYQTQLVDVVSRLIRDLKALPQGATDDQARQIFTNAVPDLMKLSKCPDYVVNRGHYFGTDMFKQEPGLNDMEKEALIAFLKTL